MSVPKAAGAGLTPGGRPAIETERTQAKGGEFEALLEKSEGERRARKKGGRTPGAGARPAEAGSGGPTEGRSRGATGSEAQTSAREGAAQHALRGEAEAEAARSAPPGASGPGGDGAASVHAGGAPPAPDAAGASDATARVERIAQQILQAAEVRLHADGAVEARLQLDLGSLGKMHVALERTAEGQIRVALEASTPEARHLLETHGKVLADRLQARGLQLQELTVKSGDEILLRIEGARRGPETAATRPASASPEAPRAERAAGPEPPPRERSDEDHERRDRREPEPRGEDEEVD